MTWNLTDAFRKRVNFHFSVMPCSQLLALKGSHPKPFGWAILGRPENTLRQEAHVINLGSITKTIMKHQPQHKTRTKRERM